MCVCVCVCVCVSFFQMFLNVYIYIYIRRTKNVLKSNILKQTSFMEVQKFKNCKS